MSKYLVIIESPGKTKSYEKYLGKDYNIQASFGHIFDLPPKKIGIDFKNDFQAELEVMQGKSDVFKDIVRKAEKSEIVYICTDPDREGSGIGWNIWKALPKNTIVKRAKTSSITEKAIKLAISNATDMIEEEPFVEAYLTRRILDRICGFKCSFPVTQATGGPSAGRVQSAALRILAEREKEIQSFVPVEYWPVYVELLTPRNEKIIAQVIDPDEKETKTEESAKAVVDTLRRQIAKVARCDTKQVSRGPYAPFTTSTLQGTCSSMFHWSQDKTMQAAQSLYEAGHITYMRTDSTFVVPGVVSDIRNQINGQYGTQYLPDKPLFYKGGKNAQEAHEAVRPTHVEATSVVTGDGGKLYQLIWKRAVASQMSHAKSENTRATFTCGKIVMAASGSRQLFDGYKKCWNYGDNEDKILPEVKVGENCQIIDVKTEQKFTQPPPRYGVATFNARLDDLGIGRPSTLKTMTKTLEDRGYVEVKKNTFHVTDMGLKVIDFLVSSKFCFVELDFTAELENKLDDILDQKTTKLKILKEFWERLKTDLENSKASKGALNLTDYDCPKCKDKGRKLVLKHSRFGEFYSCEGYSNKEDKCDYTAQVGEDGIPKEKIKKVVEKSEIKCPKCGKFLVVRHGKKDFLGCEGWPACSGIYNLDGNAIEFKKKPFYKKRKKS